MNSVIEIRDKLKLIYAKYENYIMPILKFTLALITFMLINSRLGYLSALNSMFVIVVLSVICAILPLNGIVVIGTILIVAQCFGLGLEVGGCALLVYLLMILLYFRFVPNEAWAIIMTPVCFILHMPLLVPLSLGLIGGGTSVVSAMFGVLSWEFIDMVSGTLQPMKDSGSASALEILGEMPKALFSQETILLLITTVMVVLIVVVIRKLVETRSWEIGMLVGAAVFLFLMISGSIIMKIDIQIPLLLLGTLLSLAVCWVLETFFYSVDYKKVEYVQFEDDDNYYYVKVLPKVRGMKPESLPRQKARTEKKEPGERAGEEGSTKIFSEGGLFDRWRAGRKSEEKKDMDSGSGKDSPLQEIRAEGEKSPDGTEQPDDDYFDEDTSEMDFRETSFGYEDTSDLSFSDGEDSDADTGDFSGSAMNSDDTDLDEFSKKLEESLNNVQTKNNNEDL